VIKGTRRHELAGKNSFRSGRLWGPRPCRFPAAAGRWCSNPALVPGRVACRLIVRLRRFFRGRTDQRTLPLARRRQSRSFIDLPPRHQGCCWSPTRRSPTAGWCVRLSAPTSSVRQIGQTNIVFFELRRASRSRAYDIAVPNAISTAIPRRGSSSRFLPNADIPGRTVSGDRCDPQPVRCRTRSMRKQANDLAVRLGGGRRQGRQPSIAVPRPRPGDAESDGRRSSSARSSSSSASISLGSLNYGTAVVNFNNTNPFTGRRGQPPGRHQRHHHFFRWRPPRSRRRCGRWRAAGVTRNAGRAQSDRYFPAKTATFIAGGEFPIPTGRGPVQTTTGGNHRPVRAVDLIQEIRNLAQLHAGSL